MTFSRRLLITTAAVAASLGAAAPVLAQAKLKAMVDGTALARARLR